MSIRQADLFGHQAANLPVGLRYMEQGMTPPEEAALIERLAQVPVSPFRFQGWIGKRRTASFGWHYDFDKAASLRRRRFPISCCPFATRRRLLPASPPTT